MWLNCKPHNLFERPKSTRRCFFNPKLVLVINPIFSETAHFGLISLDLDITWSHILEKSFIYNYLVEILFCVLFLSLYNMLYLMLCTFCLFNFEIHCKSKSTDYLDYECKVWDRVRTSVRCYTCTYKGDHIWDSQLLTVLFSLGNWLSQSDKGVSITM